jgi:transcriptional regulator with XRE-family HTH domain
MHRMFGMELRRRRLAAQLSLAEMAKLVHYSKSYLSKIENGLMESSADLARRCDVALSANGALAALSPHPDRANPQPATAQTEADDIWMLTLANDGSNHFMPANRRAIPAMHVALGFDIPYGQISVAAPDEATASVFQSLFHECVRLSEVVGTSAAMPTVIAQVHVLQNLAKKASGSSRERLLVLAGRYAEYAGWLAQEGGDDRAAIWWTNLSTSIAARAESVDLAAFLCARLSEIVLYEDATRSVTLARQAQLDSRVQPRIRGFAAIREAQALALTGDYNDCRRALDRATVALNADGSSTLGGLPLPPFGPTVPGTVTGWCLYDLGRLRDATTMLDGATFIPRSYRHATGRYHVRRALAHAASGEIDHACVLTNDLLDNAEIASSSIIRHDMRDLSRTLARWHTHPPVRDLSPRLATALYNRASA